MRRKPLHHFAHVIKANKNQLSSSENKKNPLCSVCTRSFSPSCHFSSFTSQRSSDLLSTLLDEVSFAHSRSALFLFFSLKELPEAV